MMPGLVLYSSILTFLTHVSSRAFVESVKVVALKPDNPAGNSAFRVKQSQSPTELTSFSSPSPGTFTTTPDVTVPYESQDLDCRNIATEFAYENNLCDARDPQSYVVSKAAFYSCSGRCGTSPPYSSSGSKECSCDAACLVYGDCCRDIHVTCPQIHESASVRYMSYGKYRSMCSNSNFLTLQECMGAKPRLRNDDAASFIPFSSNSEAVQGRGKLVLSTSIQTLEQLVYGITQFSAVDIRAGFIFENLHVLLSCKTPGSIPYFIPLVISFICPDSIPTKHRTSVTRSLTLCTRVRAGHVKTPYHRSCSVNQYINCRCGQSLYLTDHLHNACIGSNVSVSHLARRPVVSSEAGTMPVISDGDACSVQIYDIKMSNLVKDMQMSISSLPRNYAVKFTGRTHGTKTPGLAATSSRVENNLDKTLGSTSSDPGDDNSEETKAANNGINQNEKLHEDDPPVSGMSDEWIQDGRPVTHSDLIHVVEISNTIERRLLCPSLQTHVTDCQLLDCARGAILSHDPATRGSFGGSRCLWPAHLVVKHEVAGQPAPLCWCMQVLALFTNLAIWNVKMQAIESEQCVLALEMTQEDSDEPLEAYKLGMTVRLPDPRTKWTLSLEDLQELFQNLYRNTSFLCDDISIPKGIEVCFQFAISDTPEAEEENISCISIGNGEVFSLGVSLNTCPLSSFNILLIHVVLSLIWDI